MAYGLGVGVARPRVQGDGAPGLDRACRRPGSCCDTKFGFGHCGSEVGRAAVGRGEPELLQLGLGVVEGETGVVVERDGDRRRGCRVTLTSASGVPGTTFGAGRGILAIDRTRGLTRVASIAVAVVRVPIVSPSASSAAIAASIVVQERSGTATVFSGVRHRQQHPGADVDRVSRLRVLGDHLSAGGVGGLLPCSDRRRVPGLRAPPSRRRREGRVTFSTLDGGRRVVAVQDSWRAGTRRRPGSRRPGCRSTRRARPSWRSPRAPAGASPGWAGAR